MSVYTDMARKLRPFIEKSAASLDDSDALNAVELFPAWAVGVEYQAQVRVRYSGKLYRCDDRIISQIRRHSTLGSEAFGMREGPQEWTVTIAVPKRLYAQADLNLTEFSGRTVKANFYKCGDDTAVPHFLSWNPVGVPKPSFHQPDFFGDVYFE